MTIYVYMRKRLTNQGLTTEDELGDPNWSLWRTRRFPWGDLQPGNHVLLLDHWRDEDRLSWELIVTEAVHQRVDSKPDAIAHLAQLFGLDEEKLEDDAYLAGKEDGPGVLLAWRGEQLRRLNLPRPPGLKLARHGWGRLEPEEAQQLLADAARLKTPLPGVGHVAVTPTVRTSRRSMSRTSRTEVTGGLVEVAEVGVARGSGARVATDQNIPAGFPEQR
jgi:hypothetical protein